MIKMVFKLNLNLNLLHLNHSNNLIIKSTLIPLIIKKITTKDKIDRKKSANKFEEKKGKTEEPDNFNPDEKIEAIQIQLKQTLNDMQTKADHLKHLQEQINAIKLERDGKIDELHTERANLIVELQKLKSELSGTENQIGDINATMSQLKSNRIQKIRSLEDHSRALLNDKAI